MAGEMNLIAREALDKCDDSLLKTESLLGTLDILMEQESPLHMAYVRAVDALFSLEAAQNSLRDCYKMLYKWERHE